MPPLLILAAVGAGAMLGYRVLKALASTKTDINNEHPSDGEPKDLGKLEYDAQSGVYKPRS